MKTNHWGIWIDSDKPITGVVSNNTPEWLDEEICNRGINLNYEEWLKDQETVFNEAETDDEWEHYLEDEYESQPDDTILIGDWKKDKKGLYEPDDSGEYSAIVHEDVTQVVWSKYTKRTALCSPCYPGQGDLDTPGPWLAYDLPPEVYGQTYLDTQKAIKEIQESKEK